MTGSKLKVALISGGMIVNAAHIPAYRNMQEYVDIVAVCDVYEPSARATAERWGIPHYYTSAQEMLEKEKPDLVSVCTSNASHKELTMLALNHGANVLCEKPLALTYQDAKEMFDLARRRGLKLAACQSTRFTSEYLDAQELVRKGYLGDVYFGEISLVRRRGTPTWGSFHRKDVNGGGAFCDIGVHMLDAVLWIMGNPQMASVSGAKSSVLTRKGENLTTSLTEAGAPLGHFGAASSYTPDQFETEEFAAGAIRFANNAILNFKIAWALNLPGGSSISVVGDKAGLVLPEFKLISSLDRFQADIIPRRFNEERPYAGKPFSGHWYLVENYVRTLLGEEELLIRPEETLNVTAIIDAFYRSADLHREVRMDELPG